MLDILAKTFMTATRSDDPDPRLTRVRDVRNWDAPKWWRRAQGNSAPRYIDLDRL